MAAHQCPACGSLTSAPTCCGVHLDRPFIMDRERIKALRRYAHGRKGLDLDTYTLKLQAVGATSTTALTRTQYDQLLAALHRLPDRQRRST